MYDYKAEVLNVVDGDTIDVRIDCGFRMYRDERLRLMSIDAPEVRRPTKEAGDAATEYAKEKLLGQTVIIRTVKDGKDSFGRYLATIYTDDGISFNQRMVNDGHAVLKDYR